MLLNIICIFTSFVCFHSPPNAAVTDPQRLSLDVSEGTQEDQGPGRPQVLEQAGTTLLYPPADIHLIAPPPPSLITMTYAISVLLLL
jgi:hypothetical protein